MVVVVVVVVVVAFTIVLSRKRVAADVLPAVAGVLEAATETVADVGEMMLAAVVLSVSEAWPWELVTVGLISWVVGVTVASDFVAPLLATVPEATLITVLLLKWAAGEVADDAVEVVAIVAGDFAKNRSTEQLPEASFTNTRPSTWV